MNPHPLKELMHAVESIFRISPFRPSFQTTQLHPYDVAALKYINRFHDEHPRAPLRIAEFVTGVRQSLDRIPESLSVLHANGYINLCDAYGRRFGPHGSAATIESLMNATRKAGAEFGTAADVAAKITEHTFSEAAVGDSIIHLTPKGRQFSETPHGPAGGMPVVTRIAHLLGAHS